MVIPNRPSCILTFSPAKVLEKDKLAFVSLRLGPRNKTRKSYIGKFLFS